MRIRSIIIKTCSILSTLILVAIIILGGGISVAKFLGYSPMAVLSGSMKPVYEVGAVVFINTNVKYEDIAVNDVVTFNADSKTIITHRVIAIDPVTGCLTTKGDSNDTEDNSPITPEMYIGVATIQIPKMGYALMNLTTRKGIAAGLLLAGTLALLIIIPALLKPEKKEAAPVSEELPAVPEGEVKN
jgi:signal peptidase